jgi:TolB protein
MSSLSIGQILLNQFRVDAFVASGGMGAVYRVWDLKRNVPLAMKVLHSDLADDPSIFKRFKREANALKKLAHPNIVAFYGLYHTSEFAFLLERYVDGPSLKEILQKKRRKLMQVDEVLTFLKALSAALGYAHANGVVHCDVKPGNVMIDQGGNIFLTDFGIARHSESTTTTLATVGTAAYMAPEQIRGEAVTPATDIYALGVMLYEMLTGQRPFKGDDKGTESGGTTAGERIRYGHLMLIPPDPRLSNPSLSTQLAQTILRSLEKQPSLRFQNVQEFFITGCNAAGLDPNQLPDRIPSPAGFKDTDQGADRGPVGNLGGRATTTKEWNRRRLMPWMIFGISIVLVGVLILGLGKGIVPPIFPATASQNTKATLASSPVAVIPPTLTLPPTFTPVPQSTYTPTILPTGTSSPTPNSDQPWGKIVFTCQVYKDMERNQLCIINADGSRFSQLTDISSNYYASIAPDGNSVIFSSFRTGHWEIYELNLRNNVTTQVTFADSEFSGPDISPDGKYIIATRNVDDFQRIWIMNRDGSNLHEIVNMNTDCLDPVWSPDGSHILFACGPVDHKQLFIASATGANIRQITNISDLRGRSDWSPYESQIASYVGPQWHREIVLFDMNGSNMKYITQAGNNLAPSFSPDGKWITFTSYRDRYGDNDGCEIYIMRIDGSDIRRLTNNDYCDYQPRWGP